MAAYLRLLRAHICSVLTTTQLLQDADFLVGWHGANTCRRDENGTAGRDETWWHRWHRRSVLISAFCDLSPALSPSFRTLSRRTNINQNGRCKQRTLLGQKWMVLSLCYWHLIDDGKKSWRGNLCAALCKHIKKLMYTIHQILLFLKWTKMNAA